MRVSTDDQSTASQEEDLRRWAEVHQHQAEWFTDHFTGKTMERPGWLALEEGLKSGKYTHLLVWRLDRLGRTARGLTAMFADLQNYGVTLVSLKEGMDISTPAGRMMAHVLASVAQFELEMSSERKMAGIREAKKKGVYKGRRPGSYQYKNGPQKALKLKMKGLSGSQIAKTLGCSIRTVWDYLKIAGYKPNSLDRNSEGVDNAVRSLTSESKGL